MQDFKDSPYYIDMMIKRQELTEEERIEREEEIEALKNESEKTGGSL